MTFKKISMIAAATASLALLPTTQANAQAGGTQFIGQLMLNGSTFCPREWANADGQLLPISQNTALFSLLGTIYGGDGRTTFALPDLRSRVPIHTGTGPGLSTYPQGSRGGVERVALTGAEVGPHSHTALLRAEGQTVADSSNPAGNALARGAQIYSNNSAPDAADALHPQSIAVASGGGGQPHYNVQPYLTLRWCVALQGIYPSRN
ncbi:phage tail protein [Pontixanthobacter luteolus]|uniref:phage tail protein n=1 Tax=Pontixanthobacter luteolus TaxID=295089 RepID=UPI001F36361B|nr:tail fiber protein [Pontixanthobacter luteolus]